jgi:hypothetical protein
MLIKVGNREWGVGSRRNQGNLRRGFLRGGRQMGIEGVSKGDIFVSSTSSTSPTSLIFTSHSPLIPTPYSLLPFTSNILRTN